MGKVMVRIGLLLLLLLSFDLMACDCEKSTIPTAIENNDVIFLGVVRSYTEIEDTEVKGYSVDVNDIFKGSNDIQEYTIMCFGSSCGCNFSKGMQYLIYAKYIKAPQGGSVLKISSSCSRTKPITNNSDVELKYLQSYFQSLKSIKLPPLKELHKDRKELKQADSTNLIDNICCSFSLVLTIIILIFGTYLLFKNKR